MFFQQRGLQHRPLLQVLQNQAQRRQIKMLQPDLVQQSADVF